ncbi:MAG: ribonuclease R family protein [Opitutales bacterium]
MHELERQIQEHLEAPDYTPQRADQIAQALDLDPGATRRLHTIVKRRLDMGSLAKIKKDRLVLPSDADLVSGEIRFRQSGSALLFPETAPGQAKAEPFHVRAEDVWVAMHGDRVMCRRVRDERTRRALYRQKKKGKDPAPVLPGSDRQYVRVIQILQRARTELVGTLMQSRAAFYVIPDDPRIIQDILVPDPRQADLKPKPRKGDKVVVKLHPWVQRHLNPEGDIVRVLGKTHEPGAEFEGILVKYGLDPEFPEPVRREVAQLEDHVTDADRKGRLDCRDLLTVTIDPDDAKDFDDALSVEALPGDEVRVGIHIADVAHYVKPGSELDKEARKRGNSTYLVGSVIPMLPHELSNGLCSLVEAEDRLTKTVFLTFTRNGKIRETRFANTVIRSRKRLTYGQALAFLQEDDLEAVRRTPLPPKHQTGSTGRPLAELSDADMTAIRDALRTLWKLASGLRRKRFAAGSLDLDMTEVKILVDEQGYADRIMTVENDISHQLIEEFMLAANEAVARTFKARNRPAIYRVHDAPDPEKLAETEETFAAMDILTGDLSHRDNMTELLKLVKGHPQEYTLKLHVLRSLKQACYRASPDGHYGLAKTDYTHFTSPIRRYADLVVHRVFNRHLNDIKDKTALPDPKVRYTQEQLSSLAEHISITERNSVDAERESVKTKLLEFFERETRREDKSTFAAIITDIRNHGMFVELSQSQAFGMIHLSTIRDDMYYLSGDGTELVGRKHKRRFKIGQEINIQIDTVDRFKRQMDFCLAPDQPKGSGSNKPPMRPHAKKARAASRDSSPRGSGKPKRRSGKDGKPQSTGPGHRPPKKSKGKKVPRHGPKAGGESKPAKRDQPTSGTKRKKRRNR